MGMTWDMKGTAAMVLYMTISNEKNICKAQMLRLNASFGLFFWNLRCKVAVDARDCQG
jgi:hypothetical protein